MFKGLLFCTSSISESEKVNIIINNKNTYNNNKIIKNY